MKKTKITALILALIMLLALFSACDLFPVDEGGGGGTGETGEQDPATSQFVDGMYILTNKMQSGMDVTNTYLYNVLQLKDNQAIWYETDISGKSVSETGTYSLTDTTLTISIGLREYNFTYDKTAGTLAFSGRISRKAVTMDFVLDQQYSLPQDTGSVSFTQELFGEDIAENFYNYCPTILTEGADTMHIWYCSNEISGNITDYIAYRKGTLHSDGKWTFTDKQLVLQPTASTWDARHTCDPSVVKGNFAYGATTYNWLMAYLGCSTSDNTRNEVGIALAQNPEGPWVKVTELNPIANFYENKSEYSQTGWGYGQPALINIDKEGKVLLIYTKGIASGTYSYAELWDLSNINNATKLQEGMVSNVGVTNASGGTDVINNGDYAYDPATKRLYCVKEDFGYPSDGGVNWITGSNTVMYMDLAVDEQLPCYTLFTSESNRWTVFDTITQSRTGFARNHNCGIVTDSYGWILNPTKLPIVYTMSLLATDFPEWGAGGQWPALHTYRLHGTIIDL